MLKGRFQSHMGVTLDLVSPKSYWNSVSTLYFFKNQVSFKFTIFSNNL